MKITCNKKGITLIEVVLSSSMLVVILALAFSLYYFGAKTFKDSAGRSDIQQITNRAAEKITEEVRLAVEIAIIDRPSVFDDDYRYIFVNEDNFIELRRGNEITLIPDKQVEGVHYSLTFESKSAAGGSGNMLAFSIDASGVYDYSLKTELCPLNLKTAITGRNNAALAYKVNDLP